MSKSREEFLGLISRHVEETMVADEHARLQELMRSDPDLVDLYADYLYLHAQLVFDTGRSACAADFMPPTPATATEAAPVRVRSRRATVAVVVMTVLAACWLIGTIIVRTPENQVVEIPENVDGDIVEVDRSADIPPDDNATEHTDLEPLELTHHSSDTASVRPRNVDPEIPEPVEYFASGFTDDMVSSGIDGLVQAGWSEQEIDAADTATDSEWLRRVYLTFAGRIPTLEETTTFLNSRSPRKRLVTVDTLLDSGDRADHMATIWTNLLVGRTERRGVNRDKLFEFLTDSFAKNTPWIDTVGELITATGRNDENGATNFLLAHLNNQATPATAVTARLFLGEQISCVQCHDHPFSKGVRQEDYWALNAFFKDTVRVTVREPRAPKSRYMTCRLVDRRQVERITHFETHSGQQRAVLPEYDNVVVAADSDSNRRETLARLLARDSEAKIARAMVNRMWAHFFGFGFTNPVDDMGPHAVVSHPELLDLLTEAFVKSDYDVRRLMRWIALSSTWQLGSELRNTVDVPEHGETPLFTRVYTRRMTPEQVYESVRVAIRSASGQSLEHTPETLEHRRQWVAQFARDYQTDENDEDMNFEGTIAQALVMMNGVEVDRAIQQATSAILTGASGAGSEVAALQRVARSILSREPTPGEKQAFRQHYRLLSQRQPEAASLAVEDMMWAYLNSSEFVLVH